jgi:protein NrfC
MMACTLVHEGGVNLSHARVQIKKSVFGTRKDDQIEIFVCRQCDAPSCVDECPTGALHIDEMTGARVIDEKACDGCRRCVKGCKLEPPRIAFDFDNRKALKCDLCQNAPHWNEKGGIGGKQACVDACALKAIILSSDMPET